MMTIRSQTSDFHEIISVFSGKEYPREILERVLPTDPVILDVGAHIGCFTIWIKRMRPDARMFSFEPEGENFAVLKRNISENNLSGVSLINAAVWAETGTASFHVPTHAPNLSCVDQSGEVQVTTVTLDEFVNERGLDRVDLLKLDCEGAEYELLAGFHRLDVCHAIVMEYHEPRDSDRQQGLEEAIRRHGMEMVYHRPSAYAPGGVLFYENRRFQTRV
jgi:FkbM family methyltransferase